MRVEDKLVICFIQNLAKRNTRPMIKPLPFSLTSKYKNLALLRKISLPLPIASFAVTIVRDHHTEHTLSPETWCPAVCSIRPKTRYSDVNPTASFVIFHEGKLLFAHRLDHLWIDGIDAFSVCESSLRPFGVRNSPWIE